MRGSTVLQNISTGLGLFWDDFQQRKKFRVRPGPTHFHSQLRFREFFSLQSPVAVRPQAISIHHHQY